MTEYKDGISLGLICSCNNGSNIVSRHSREIVVLGR